MVRRRLYKIEIWTCCFREVVETEAVPRSSMRTSPLILKGTLAPIGFCYRSSGVMFAEPVALLWRSAGDLGARTSRTLDEVDGAMELEDKLEQGWLCSIRRFRCFLLVWCRKRLLEHGPIRSGICIFRLWAWLFQGALKDFFTIWQDSHSLLPRYALGNWWAGIGLYTSQRLLVIWWIT